MGTGIEWTDETWNPTVGCSKVSEGCGIGGGGCYAIDVAHRAMQSAHEGLTIKRPGEPTDWTGEVRCLPDRLDTPLHWRRPRRVFVDSMSDLFHADVPNQFIVDVFARMVVAPRHTFQVLTKRPQRMASLLRDPKFHHELHYTVEEWIGEDEPAGADFDAWLETEHRCVAGGPVWPNIWLGTSIESDRYGFRADYLRRVDRTEVPVRFLSLEPLLGPLPDLDLTGVDWVIVGGESGPHARPMHPEWAREIRDQCVDAGVPFLFKQWGAWLPVLDGTHRVTYGGEWYPNRPTCLMSNEEMVRRVGKKAAGRVLDGRTWDEYPQPDSLSVPPKAAPEGLPK